MFAIVKLITCDNRIIVTSWKSSHKVENFRYSLGSYNVHFRKHICKCKYWIFRGIHSPELVNSGVIMSSPQSPVSPEMFLKRVLTKHLAQDVWHTLPQKIFCTFDKGIDCKVKIYLWILLGYKIFTPGDSFLLRIYSIYKYVCIIVLM